MASQQEDPKYFSFFGLTFPVYQQLIIKSTIYVWIIMLMILLVAISLFQYEMTNADLPCGALAGFLLGYLTTLIIKW